jgi:hypothetical protein
MFYLARGDGRARLLVEEAAQQGSQLTFFGRGGVGDFGFGGTGQAS